MRYTVDENNTVRIWITEQDEPNVLQPWWPDQTPFADAAEATAYAEAMIAHNQDPENNVYPYVPGDLA